MSINIEDNISVPLLDASNNIEADIIKSYAFDRVAGETQKLPHSFNSIKLNPNTILTSDILNDSIEKLYNNF